MRKITVISFITLDGVIQAPGGPKEDSSNNFKYGGWIAPYGDEVMGRVIVKIMEPADLMLGRKTFDIWESYWPKNADRWPGINEVTKYVLSNTISVSDWENCIFLRDLTNIRTIKNSEGSDIKIWGSSKLVQLLLKHDLVDEIWLMTYPVVLGKGKKLFNNTANPAAFELVESHVTTTGIILANYRKAGNVRTGSIGE